MCFLGLDLGKRHDYTAIAIVERLEQAYGQKRHGTMHHGTMVVRYLERVPLRTTYPAVVEQVRQLVSSRQLRGRCSVIVDATGVGEPVVDMLRAARLGCEIIAVTISGGAREGILSSGQAPAVSVPKVDLIAGVQVLLESGELRIAASLRETATLVRELVDMRVSSGMRGHVRIGADGTGQHDDLVIALALAVWKGKKVRPPVGYGGGRLF